MLALLKLTDGSVSIPSASFNSESSTGMFRPTANFSLSQSAASSRCASRRRRYGGLDFDDRRANHLAWTAGPQETVGEFDTRIVTTQKSHLEGGFSVLLTH